jgi:hypothetical protein
MTDFTPKEQKAYKELMNSYHKNCVNKEVLLSKINKAKKRLCYCKDDRANCDICLYVYELKKDLGIDEK